MQSIHFHQRQRSLVLYFTGFLFVMILAVLATKSNRVVRAALPINSAANPVEAAWQKLGTAQSYQFTADVKQRTLPPLTLNNLGREAKTEAFTLQGKVFAPRSQMELTLFQGEGSLLKPETGVAIRVDGLRAYARAGNQGDWQEIENFTGLFAPAADALLFLKSAENVQLAEARADGFTRYTFDVNRAEFGRLLRAQLEAQLRENGQLPPGLQVSLPEAYAQMQASGEFWLNAEGLPARQQLWIALPGANPGERVQAEVDTMFEGFAFDPRDAAQSWGLPRLSWSPIFQVAALILGFGAAFWVFATFGSRRSFKIAFAVTMMTTILVTPLMQSSQVRAYFETQTARQQQLTQAAEPGGLARAIEAQRAAQQAVLPAHVALNILAADDGRDSDRDGLTDAQEVALGSSPFSIRNASGLTDLQWAQQAAVNGAFLLADSGADADGDGLTDYQEQMLGTSSSTSLLPETGQMAGVDSDFDGVRDDVEVHGFTFGSVDYYGNPLESDTSGDSLPDGLEWYVPNTTTIRDTDSDGVPDAFDDDNDGDGVPDRYDISPFSLSTTVFDAQNPLLFSVQNATEGAYTYAEFQLRPDDANYLRYAFNVLDWGYDSQGQMKDLDGATFYDVDPTLPPNPNANGDIKLVPMLEIRTGVNPSGLPVLAAPPPVTVNLQGANTNAIGGQVYITQQGADLHLQYSGLPGGTLTHAIYDGTCGELSAAPVRTLSPDGSGLAVLTGTGMDWLTNNASRSLVTSFSSDLNQGYACASLPILPKDGAKWVDTPLLANYAINVVPALDGSGLTVYVPLQLTQVKDTDEKVAFYGKMLYQPAAGWGSAHVVRLVWLIQALVDECASDNLAACTRLNDLQVLHTYNGAFTLTGVNVREERGLETAILYEDPAVDDNLYRDDTLGMFSQRMEATFLAGYDCDTVVGDACVGNGAPDFTLAEIQRRFDHATNAAVTDDERFGLPNFLSVRRFDYAHADQAMADMIQVQHKAVLNDVFLPHAGAANFYPLLMTLSTHRFRSVNLEGNGQAAWNGSALALNLQSAALVENANMAWQPFEYTGSSWRTLSLATYWDELGARYASNFVSEPDADVAAGKLTFTRMYFVALTTGVNRTIKVNDVLQATSYAQTRPPMALKIVGYGGALGKFLIDVVYVMAVIDKVNPSLSLSYLGKFTEKIVNMAPLGGKILGLFQMKASAGIWAARGAVIVGLALLAIVAVAALITYLISTQYKNNAGWKIVSQIGDTVVTSIVVFLNAIKPVISILKAAKSASSLMSITDVFGTSVIGAVLMLVVNLAIIWGTFFYAWASGAITPDTIAFNSFLALTIAQTLLAVLAFALSLTVWGALLVGIITAIDAVLSLLCKTFEVKTACFSIAGVAAEIIANSFYGAIPTFDLTRARLGVVQNLDVTPVDSAAGWVHGAQVAIRATVASTIPQAVNGDPQSVARTAYKASQFFTPNALRRGAVRYSINDKSPVPEGQTYANSAQPDSMPNDWVVSYYETHILYISNPGGFGQDRVQFDIYRGTVTGDTNTSYATLTAGINSKIPATLYMDYSLPAAECWGNRAAAICNTKFIGNTEPVSLGDLGIVMDVFPATLDEFYNWAALGTQRDRDADGLTATAFAGLDTDDSNWDQDGDGLSDGKENQLRLQGIGTLWDSPAGFDTDGDGLSDRDELRYGTNPALADADYDGLTDKEELDGWLWAYSFDGTSLQTRVTSDPNSADTDGDGNNDALERNIYQAQPLVYRYHPRQVNPAVMTTLSSISDLDGFVGPGQVFTYSVNVGNTTFYTAPFGMEGNIEYTYSGQTLIGLPALDFATLQASFDNLNAGQNTWVNTPVTALGGSYANQDLTILSNVTGNLYNPGSASSVSWATRPRLQFNPNGHYVTTGSPYFAALAAAPSNWNEPYLAASVVMDGAQISGRYVGELHAYALRDTARKLSPIQSGITPYPLRESAPAVACAANRCLIVWVAFPEGAAYPELHARLLTSGGVTFNPQFRIAPGQLCSQLHPAAASDGVNFAVTWTCGTLVYAAPVSNFQSGDVTLYGVLSDTGLSTHAPRTAITWAGDRYIAAWTRRVAETQLDLYGFHLDSNATPIGGAESPIFTGSDNEHLPSLAYNPAANSVLLTYNVSAPAADPANTFCRVRGAILPTTGFTPTTTFDVSGTICQHYGSSATYDPRNQNWAVAYVTKNGGAHQVTLQEYNASGTAVTPARTLTYGSLSVNPIKPALACNDIDCAVLTYADVVARPGEKQLFFDRQTLKAQYPHIGAALDSNTVRVRIDTSDPTMAAISGLPDSGFVRANSYYVIGGTASDSYSGIEKVEVQLFSGGTGAWQPAQGAATWLYGLNIPAIEGSEVVIARATDYAGNTKQSFKIIYIDATPPNISSAIADETQLALSTNAQNRFVIPLSGSINDPNLASGTPTDQTRLTLEVNVTPNSSGWQTATISGGAWMLNYPLAAFDAAGEILLDPTARYTVTLRATDAVGNRTPEAAYTTFNLRIDNNAPQPAWLSPQPGTPTTYLDGLLVTPPTTATYTASLVISGTLFETGTVQSGVSAVQVRFTPLEDPVPPGLWRAQYFNNTTQSGAPLLQRTEETLAFDWGSSAPDSALPADGFSARYTRDILLRASGQYTFTLNKDPDSTAAIWVNGIRQLDLAPGDTTATITLTLSLGTHAFVVDYADLGGAATLRWRGNLQTPAWISIDAAHPGAATSSWRSAIPAALEGFYRLDLRGRDLQGNLSPLTSPAIEAEIDAAPPRIFYEMTYSGLRSSAQTHFTFLATDLNLSENGLLTPCDLTTQNRHTLQTDYTNAYGSGEPRLYQIFVQCSTPGHLLNKPAAQACDAYGQCTAADTVSLTDPDARMVYLTPADGSLLEANLRNAASRVLVSSALPGMVSVDRTDGAVFYPNAGAQILRYTAIYSNTTLVFTDASLAQDYAVTTNRIFALEPNALRYANKDGSAAGSLGVQNAVSLGVSGGGYAVWVAATMPDGVSGRIYAWNSALNSSAQLDSLDPALYNGWRAVSVAHDVQRGQLYLAGWCGDPLAGAGPAPRTAIYGIHRLTAPMLLSAGNLKTNVTGCVPLIRETDPNVTIARVRVDDLARKIYFVRNNNVTGEYALWRAELDGSLQQLVYVATQPITSFDFAENRQPQPYPPSAVVRADESVNIRVSAYDTFDNDPLRFSILTPPQNGSVSAPVPLVTTANQTWIQYTPVVSYTGPDSFAVQVDDGRGGMAAATVNVTVLPPYLIESSVVSYTTALTHTSAYGNVTLFATLGEPITLTTRLQAERGLGQLIVRANGSIVSNQILSSALTETLHTVTFYPGAPGLNTLTTELRDAFGKWQTNLYPRTLYVAHEYPQVVVTPTVLTTTHQTWNGWLKIFGTTQSVAGSRYLTVDVAGVGRALNRAPVGDTWQAWSNVGSPPDNVTYVVTATLEDSRGVPTTTVTTITADLLPPSEVSLTAGVQGGGALAAGDTVREPAPTLTLNWTAATDGAGVSGYYVGWTTSPTPNRSALTFYPVAATHLQSGFADAQAYYAHLGSRDIYGNIRWQTLGPVYLDAPTTPDLIDITAYNGWLNSSGALLAADYDAYRDSSYQPVQRVFASWNTTTFAVAWTGTDIYNYTDLYAYFDTGASGGATQAWLPGGAPPVTATLPTGFSADYLLRVTSGATILYQWDGTAWSNPQTAGNVAGFTSAFSMWDNDRVVVRIPFGLLGISNPAATSMRLLALAAERNTAQFWAAAPDKNPLNSLRAANLQAWRAKALHTFAFTQQVIFASLGSGVIPNGGLFRESDLRVWLTAQPGGLMIGYLDSSRFAQLTPGAPLDADHDGTPDQLTGYTADFVPLKHGQTVTYTLHYANDGTQTAEGVTLNLTSSGAITGAPAVLNLGSIAAGSSGSITFTAQVNNPANLLSSGEVIAALHDARHTDYDWLWAMHAMQGAAPSNVFLPGADGSIVGNVTQWTAGSAYDPGGLQAAELRLTSPDTSVSVSPCTMRNNNQAFVCVWNPTGAGAYSLEARARNRAGIWSDWGAPAIVTVDTTTPVLAFDAATLNRLAGISGGVAMPFSGTATDDVRLGRVQVCLIDTGFVRSCAESLLSGTSANWHVDVPVPWQRDGNVVNYEAVLYDAAGYASLTIAGSFNFDNQYPTGGVYRTPNQRFYSEFHQQPLPNTPPVCSGTVWDGTSVSVSGFWQGAGIPATPITPTLDVTTTFGLLRHDFDIRLPLDRAGTFTVTLTARDTAGNSSTFSPCVFEVTPEVDLALQVSALPTTTLTTNGIVTYTYNITNSDFLTATGASLSIYPGALANPFSPNAELELLAVNGAVCDTTWYGWYACALPELGRNAAHQVTFRYLAHVRLPFTNTVSASVISNGFDLDTSNQFNRTASVTAQLASDLSLGATGPLTVPYGVGVLTYTVTLTNTGPSPLLAAEGMGAKVYFNFHSVDYSVTASGSGWACSIPPEFGGGLMVCNHAGFPIGSLPPLTLRVNFDPTTVSLSTFDFYHASSFYDTSVGNDSQSFSPQVVIASDLGVMAALSRSQMSYTELATLVMTVTNNGPTSFPSGWLQVGLPEGLGHENDSPGCGGVYSIGCLFTAPFAPGESRVFNTDLRVWDTSLLHNVTVTVPLTVTLNYGTDPNPLNDTTAVALYILPAVNLEVQPQGSFGGVYGHVGVPLTYTLQVQNLGPDDATGVITLTHEISTGLQYQSFSGSGWACAFTGNTLTCGHPALPSGNAAPLSVRVLPQAPANFSGAVSVTGPDFDNWLGNNVTTQKVSIYDVADVRLTKTAAISQVNPGDTLNYVLQVTNQAATAPTAWVVLTDTLPANVMYTGFTASRAFINCTHNSGTVVCDADAGGGSAYTLYAGETWTITLQTQVLAGTGTFTNTAMVTHGDPDPTPADLTASAAVDYAPLPVTADWRVFKSAVTQYGSTNGFEIDSKVVAPAAPGEEILYQIGVTHKSAAHPWDFREIVLTDTLPTGVTFSHWDDTSDFTACTNSGQIVRCELSLLPYSGSPYGTTRSASFYATLPMTVSVFLTNTLASASLAMTDTNPANNSDYATVQVVNVIDLSLSVLQQTPAVVYPGDTFSLMLEAYNWLTQPAGQLRLTYLHTPGVTLLSASSGWVCTPASTKTTCTYAAALDGETALPITLTLQAATAGTFYPNFVLLGAPDAFDANPWDNQTEHTLKVFAPADLQLNKTANHGSVTPGGLLTYTLTITNLGGGAATGIRLTDTLPAGVQLITYTANLPATTCAYAGGALTCQVTPSARLLLVDESSGGYASDNLRAALDSMALPYTLFNGVPNTTTLSAYDAVIWITSPNPPPSAAGIGALQTYMNNGRKLLLIAPGYADAVGGMPDTLMADHLGVAAVSTYTSDYVDQFTGQNAFATAGSVNSYDWRADALQPNAQAQVAIMAHHLSGVSNPAALYTARSVFFAFNWSGLYDSETTYALSLLNSALNHLISPLQSGQSAQIQVRVRAPLALGNFTNSAQVNTQSRDSNPLNNADDLTLAATLLPQSGNGPGGVADTDGEDALVLWLRADRGSSAAPGLPVMTWLDQSGYAHNATGGAALLTSNFANAQPALTFSATVPYTLTNFRLDEPYTVFIVARQNGAAQNALLTNPTGTWQFGPVNGNDVLVLPGFTFSQSGSSDAAVYMAWQDASGAAFYKNGLLLGSGTPAAYPGGVQLGGRTSALSDGALAEVIVLRGVLNSVQRTLIHNYLSAKYNIPLDESDLFSGDNVPDGNFDHVVAGIGRAADGTHPLAHSAGLYLLNSGFLQDDGDYLIMGHNGLTGNTTLDLPSGGLWDFGAGQRWLRAWYIAKTDVNNNGGTLTLVFDLSEGGTVGTPLEPASNYRLLKRSALTGAFTDIATATRIEGDQVIFEGVDASLIGSHFTLGTVDTGSPMAIRLTRLEAHSRSWWQLLWDWLRGE